MMRDEQMQALSDRLAAIQAKTPVYLARLAAMRREREESEQMSDAMGGYTPFPIVVCLCGSTRFYTAFQQANYRETMAGRIVLTVGFYPHATEQAHGEQVGITTEQKAALDDLHKRKIDLADEIYVLNVGGYVGDSTRSEIAYAAAKGRRIRWLEPDKASE